jgi:dsDNA-specific endonuclease/ATPase MutS2
MQFKPGDKVSILNESGFCTFLGQKNNRALIQDENGFEREVDYKYIVRYNKFNVTETYLKQVDLTQKKKIPLKITSSIQEIDLHIEVLLEKSDHLSAHDKFLFQIEVFRKFTNKMLKERQSKFVVIHGAGEGKLKSEIQSLLQSRKGFRMHDKHVTNGKVGASLIEIFLSEADEI